MKILYTTADIWSAKHRTFLGYTCHWLTDNFERKSVTLACKRIFAVHTDENIAQIITEINTSFGLNTLLTPSTLVKRLFSFAGIVNSPGRQSLSDFCFKN